MIKAVLFDLDGTLLDRDASVVEFIDKQYERQNGWLGHIPKAQYMTRFIELDNHGYVWKDKVYQQLVKEFEITNATWEKLLQDYIDEFKNHCVPFSNLLRLLEELKNRNLKLGIITNGYGQFQMDNIEALGIKKYFETILVSEWEGTKKPDPQLFEKALKQLDVEPFEAVFIGDHPENDVNAAKRVGMKTVWKNDMTYGQADADFIIDNLTELIPIIEKLR